MVQVTIQITVSPPSELSVTIATQETGDQHPLEAALSRKMEEVIVANFRAAARVAGIEMVEQVTDGN